ncbi:MAG: carbon-nitrogen hydrolase family protein [Alphaproteobacteria bacterium]|nr:carbon-nitrogen hydrolase family protein [Alphaproteobacteria bacterium]
MNQPEGARHLRLCVAQTCSTNAHEGNVAALRAIAERAAVQECQLLCLPEAAGLMNRDVESARKIITREEDDPYLAACREMAAKYGIWVHSGSTPIRAAADLPVNRTHLIDSAGEIVARYDKIHLFDVCLADGIERLESKRYTPGDQSVLVDTPWGPFGLSICYDLRFPHLYREYAKEGATLLFAPSAFTRPTGKAHWEMLLRTRAVENGCFMVAAAQTGEHDDGRKTYGHSMVVHPWGNIMMDLGDAVQEGILDIDLTDVETTRQQIPSLNNERDYRMHHTGSNDQMSA